MTNAEKYAEEIVTIAQEGNTVAVNKITQKPCGCRQICCSDCLFYSNNDNCREQRSNWFKAEYEAFAKWRRVPIDTLVYVRDEDDEVWRPRYFAGLTDEFNVQFPFSTWSNGASSITTEYGAREYWAQIKLYGGEAD